jgi:hypothetical protein
VVVAIHVLSFIARVGMPSAAESSDALQRRCRMTVPEGRGSGPDLARDFGDRHDTP